MRRSAHREVVSLLQCGLELIEQQPETPERHAEEFAFRSMMAPATMAVKGFAAPEAVLNFQRARANSDSAWRGSKKCTSFSFISPGCTNFGASTA